MFKNFIMEKVNKNFLIVKKVVSDMGGTIKEFVPERNCFYVKIKDRKLLLENNISISRQSFTSVLSTKCKEVTYKLLIANGLFSPATKCFYVKTYTAAEALRRIKTLRFPIILKNATGSNSRGVFSNVVSPKEAIEILNKELPRYRSMVAQEMVYGKEYRILVLENKVIGALEMIPPYIIGDGLSTVCDLIKEKQSATKEQTKFDKKLNQILGGQKVTLDTVVSKNKLIYIKRNSCLAQGGETQDVTDLVHEDVKDICVAASKTVGRYLVGVDAICQDISKEQTKTSFNILEINSKPDLYIHYNPTYGKSRNVLGEVIKFLVQVA